MPGKKTEKASPEFIEGIQGGSFRDVKLKLIALHQNDLEFRVSPRIGDLVEDIKKNGQQFPVILRPLEGGGYEVVSGYRRIRAIEKLGWETVKAVVRDDLYDDDKAYQVSFIENERRRNLTGTDKANAIAKLELLGKSPEQIQAIYGIGRRQYERYKKVGTFPKVLKDTVSENKISTGHGLMLMQAYEQHGRKVNLGDWVKRVEDEDLSVRRLKSDLNKEYGKGKKKVRYFEKQGKGFRLYPMRFDPEKTDDETRKKMAEKLKEALRMLEGE